jgi:hypothetical protein
MMITPSTRSLTRSPVITDRGDLLGRFADFTVGTAVVLWHLALASRDRRSRAAIARPWSSTR